MHRVLIATLFSIVVASTAVAASPVAEVHLVLDEASVLPGTPTGLSVVVTNRRHEGLQLPPLLWLVAKNDVGDTFTLRAQLTTDGEAEPVPAEKRTIEAGGSREFRYDPTFAIVASPWLTDDRLSPGRYRLRAVFASEVKPDGRFDLDNAIASSEEVLAVSLESPEDVAVWEWLRKAGGGKWGDRAWLSPQVDFADFVMKNYPTSHYALFAAVFLPRHSDEPPLGLEEIVKRFPNKSFTDQARLLLIQYYEQAESLDQHRSDMIRAANHSDAARAIAFQLVRNSRSSNVRTFAKELLDRIPTREQLLRKPEAR